MPFDRVQRHAAGAVRRGVSFDRLLSESMIDLHHGHDQAVVSPAQHLLFCMNTVLSAGDATHALARSGVGQAYPAIGLRMALGCASLEGAIQALARLYAHASTAVRIDLTTDADDAILSVRMDAADDRDAAQLEENYLTWMFMHCLHFLGRAPPISGVTVRDPLHFNQGVLHWGIGGPVDYGAITALRFPRALLAEPAASRAGANVQWECHQLWLSYLAERPEASPAEFVGGAGFVRFADIVEHSGVSSNTLRRQLQSLNGGFREARRRALTEAAMQRLRAGRDSVEAIAADLGYSDARSLRRFLKNATGLTPQEVRSHPTMPGENQAVLIKVKALSEILNV
ncbi:MAG: helix-turn-helix domain-containing protein [Alphaproteobacteria bacterium]|nr:helix-turn-helix domain-containing protein [Alphaproteobacteria bacterium]MBU1512468.1 helix-turn-helix domain-containing protein [Alphaproteobacteria bacterium]MBU2096608.1 helix-turn-helix domain-containing protein [Alphaproteobacteria bacterium]MBU2151574.1 helix-turn-helix domain-containing protein [Alphaproteobacteria bacterium]MBU2307291.1 helix-turn-helix domain-containing protein [Alphaproteobacteria bacterium]